MRCESIVATPDPSLVAICSGTSKGQAWGSLLTVVNHQNYMSTNENKGDKKMNITIDLGLSPTISTSFGQCLFPWGVIGIRTKGGPHVIFT